VVSDVPVLKAILVEYSAVALRRLHATLTDLGFAVAATSNPEQALTWMERHRPHVILVDFSMPSMTSDDFVARARGSFGGAGIPVIATGTRHLTEAPIGAVAWLSKPADRDDVEAALATALAASEDRGEEEARRRRAPVQPDQDAVVTTTTGATAAIQGAVLTWFPMEGRVTLPIEAVTEAGLRVRSGRLLELGSRLNAQVDYVEVRRSGNRPRQIKLVLRVDSISEVEDGWTLGLRVEMARPPHIWKRFAQRGIY
jgi:CheY-like chemotaxis protein